MPTGRPPEEDGLLVRMKKMMKTKKMTDYFAASPSGKMILFTKKKMTIEMPPLSTVVPVSYTHLDVYKRQVPERVRNM